MALALAAAGQPTSMHLRSWIAAGTAAMMVSLAAILLSPAQAAAATPSRAPGSVPDVEPPDSLAGVGEAALIVIGLVVVLAAFAVLGRLVAGSVPAPGRSAAQAHPEATAISAALAVDPAPQRVWIVVLGVAAVAAVVGFLAGREVAFQQSLGGLKGAIQSGLLMLAIGAAVVGLGGIGLSALVLRRGAMTPVIAGLLTAATLLGGGAVVGSATAADTDGVYRSPVVLESSGATDAVIEGGTLAFLGNHRGEADCYSGPDSLQVSSVVGLALGELGSGTLRAWVSLPTADGGPAGIELLIDGADLDGGAQPVWSGRAAFESRSEDRTRGRVQFSELELQREEDPTMSLRAWPPTLSGTIEWACDPWRSTDDIE